MRFAVFGYGSLVSVASASRTLGRPVGSCPLARLSGWRRRWSEKRDNLTCEKTFADAADGRTPTWVLGLNIEPAGGEAEAPNGVLIEVAPEELERLDVREMRYHRYEVTELVEPLEPAAERFDRVLAYSAKDSHLAVEPPADAVILATYARAVEEGFAALGDGHLDAYRRSTGPYPVELIDPVLVRDEIPPGNPRDW